jgi:multidrug efflux pump subunit AcrA (membrane-fusion protein)
MTALASPERRPPHVDTLKAAARLLASQAALDTTQAGLEVELEATLAQRLAPADWLAFAAELEELRAARRRGLPAGWWLIPGAAAGSVAWAALAALVLA